jgi:hypothetical protein
VAWASGVGASFRALGGGSDAAEVELAATLAAALGAAAAPVPLLEHTAELLEAALESSRAAGEPWSEAALEGLAPGTAAAAAVSAEAASAALAFAAEVGGCDDAGEALGACAVARLRACAVLARADAAWTRRGGPGSLALLEALARGAALQGTQWRPFRSSSSSSGKSGRSSSRSRSHPAAPPLLRRAAAVCLSFWAAADFRAVYASTHPALAAGDAHRALLERLLAPNVHSPPTAGAAREQGGDDGDDEDEDDEALAEWRAFREQDVAAALGACHAALGSGPYLEAVLAALRAAVAASAAPAAAAAVSPRCRARRRSRAPLLLRGGFRATGALRSGAFCCS